jgi:hypothetical protein
MVVKRRAGMLLSGTVLASIIAAAPALAQDAQTDQLQHQINALQRQAPKSTSTELCNNYNILRMVRSEHPIIASR